MRYNPPLCLAKVSDFPTFSGKVRVENRFAMVRPFQDVTDAELSVLKVLWAEEEATIRQITDKLYPRGSASDYATVQKLLERLEGKRAVRRQRKTPAHLFTAALSREGLISHRLRRMAEKICGGSFTPLLTQLVEDQPLTPDERRRLRALLDELEGGSNGSN